eukprot:189499-Amphidinium_carterae.1
MPNPISFGRTRSRIRTWGWSKVAKEQHKAVRATREMGQAISQTVQQIVNEPTLSSVTVSVTLPLALSSPNDVFVTSSCSD